MSSDQIYNYTGQIRALKRRLGHAREAETAIKFLDALLDYGLSKGRLTYYGERLPKICRWFEGQNISLADATTDDCRRCLREITGDHYAGATNQAFAQTLKRLIHFAKTGKIGEKKEGRDYVEQVSWISPRSYAKRGRKREIKPGDLLTTEEIEALADAIDSVGDFPDRDKPMVVAMYEGAFRPGELLNMTVGGVLFKEKLAIMSTTGKTGEKTVPLLLTYKLLLGWLRRHPFKGDPNAPLWWSFKTKKAISYSYLQHLVKKAARKAGIKKRVWNYLLRHTKLTDVARKHPDQILKKFGNWKKGTQMMDVYVHLSDSDMEEAVLREHGLAPEEKRKELTLKYCPRCAEQNAVGAKTCDKCGYVIDEQLAAKIAQESRSQKAIIESYARGVAKLQREYNELREMLVKVQRKGWVRGDD